MDEFRIEHELNHTYLVLDEWYGDEDYRFHMLSENDIPGLLSIQKRTINATVERYVDITGLQSLEDMFSVKDMHRSDVKRLYEAIHNMANVAAEYLLNEDSILLSPKLIYYDINHGTYKFVCNPASDGKEGYGIKDLLLYLMQHMDSDEVLVKTVYSAYGYAESGTMSFESLHYMLSENIYQADVEDLEEPMDSEQEKSETLDHTTTSKSNFSRIYIPSFIEVIGVAMLCIGLGMIGYDIYLSMLI